MREQFRFYFEIADEFASAFSREESREFDELGVRAEGHRETLSEKARMRDLLCRLEAVLRAVRGNRKVHKVAYDEVIAARPEWKRTRVCRQLPLHASYAKVVFFALDAVLMSMYNHGVFIALGRYDRYARYIMLYGTLFPEALDFDRDHPNDASLRVTAGALESFRSHLRDCPACRITVEDWRDRWSQVLMDFFLRQ